MWFAAGTVFGIVTLVASPLMLLANLVLMGKALAGSDAVVPPVSGGLTTAQSLSLSTAPGGEGTAMLMAEPPAASAGFLQPILPCVTVPCSHVVYLVLALLISGVFHELGHALAAAQERVDITGFGGFLMVVYPGAFVELSSGQLERIGPWSRLRIYCAGVWHNAALAALAALALVCYPTLMDPLYSRGQGVRVVGVEPQSALSASLRHGDVVTGFDGACTVRDLASWQACKRQLRDDFVADKSGVCVPPDVVSASLLPEHQSERPAAAQPGGGRFDCCATATTTPGGGSQLCFAQILNEASLPNWAAGGAARYGCLPVRHTLSKAYGRCRTGRDCGGFTCIRHTDDAHHARLLHFQRANGDAVLLLGPLEELGHVWLDDVIPRSASVPAELPRHIDTQLRYVVSMSAGLAVLNIVPAFWLDGEGAVHGLIDGALPGLPQHTREAAKLVCCGVGLALLGFNLLFAGLQVVL